MWSEISSRLAKKSSPESVGDRFNRLKRSLLDEEAKVAANGSHVRCCLKKYWTEEEDAKLKREIAVAGGVPKGRVPRGFWLSISKCLPGWDNQDCSNRYTNCLAPTLCHAPFGSEEDNMIIKAVTDIGPSWRQVVSQLPKKCSQRMVKCRWVSHLRDIVLAKHEPGFGAKRRRLSAQVFERARHSTDRGV